MKLIYVCEDDYLHVPHAMTAMKALFDSGYEGFYAPYDYPDRYTIDTSRHCELHVWNYGHLRSIPSATLTIAAKGSTWLKYKFELLRAGAFADDSWTWKAFKQSGAFMSYSRTRYTSSRWLCDSFYKLGGCIQCNINI